MVNKNYQKVSEYISYFEDEGIDYCTWRTVL